MTIIHLPKSVTERHHPLPEFQPVEDDSYALPQPGVSEPIHIQALRGTLPPGTCNACGEPTELHMDTTGALWVGCAGVLARRKIAELIRRPLQHTTTYGDPHPTVSAAVRDAFRVALGPDASEWFDSLTADQRLHLSRRLAEIAAVATWAEDAHR